MVYPLSLSRFLDQCLSVRRVAELNQCNLEYIQMDYHDYEKLFPVDVILASDLIYHSSEGLFSIFL